MEEKIISDSDKKKLQRSASYPGVSIEEVIDFVSKVKKAFPTSSFKRDDVTAILKKSTIHIDIAAGVQYGLIERIGDSYKLSARVQSILNFVTEQEKKEAIADCFNSPKLYVELIEKFKGHVVPPDQQLKAILSRFHGITENAAPKVCELFINNAIFANALNENRILYSETHDFRIDEKIEDSAVIQSVLKSNKPIEEIKPKLYLEEMNSSRDLKIYLSEKKVAHLIYPDGINEKDIQILKYQIEALALTL